MSFWRGRPGQVPPAALVLLGLFFVLPFALYFLPRSGIGQQAYEPPRYETRWAVPAGEADSAPTTGMTLGANGFGTVTDAPQALATQPPPGSTLRRFPDPLVAPDVARFFAAFPVRTWLNPPEDGVTTCTLEGPMMWQGHLELRDGCLLFIDDRGAPPALALIAGAGAFRDPEGFLAVGLAEGEAQYRIRVGERGGTYEGHGCSRPDYIPAPAGLAKACGVKRMVNIAQVTREAWCSPETLERVEAQAEDYRRYERARREAEALCRAKQAATPAGRPAEPCQPVAPPAPLPYDLHNPGCKLPDGFRERLLAE
ncbi:hypothetical protein VCJ71_09375 [Alteriqipengyuania sp. WL0013]|uniref:hypothetical protein n=1 Tax=Alteriqipengyuania sp. WL0013 TaxID=3110773 RepID=UPI002B56D751|nr:hypothetical protein [Alteriqipengyuania sp. WL0013]MEB3416275.1 hypothetical protein [Alteriqipengyuania sp. WL0013]